MKKRNNTPDGSLFSPARREVVRRLKGKEAELESVVMNARKEGCHGERETEEPGENDEAHHSGIS